MRVWLRTVSGSDQSAAQRSSEIQKQELRHTIFAALGKGEAKVDSRSASAVEAGQQQKLWPKESFLRRNFFPPPCRKETRMSPFFEIYEERAVARGLALKTPACG